MRANGRLDNVLARMFYAILGVLESYDKLQDSKTILCAHNVFQKRLNLYLCNSTEPIGQFMPKRGSKTDSGKKKNSLWARKFIGTFDERDGS